MNEIQHLLTVLAEESSEVAQRATKAIRFGLMEVQPGQQENNTRRLERELAELVAVADLLGLKIRDDDKVAKIEKLKRMMDYSRQVGALGKYDPVKDIFTAMGHVTERPKKEESTIWCTCVPSGDGTHHPDCVGERRS